MGGGAYANAPGGSKGFGGEASAARECATSPVNARTRASLARRSRASASIASANRASFSRRRRAASSARRSRSCARAATASFPGDSSSVASTGRRARSRAFAERSAERSPRSRENRRRRGNIPPEAATSAYARYARAASGARPGLCDRPASESEADDAPPSEDVHGASEEATASELDAEADGDADSAARPPRVAAARRGTRRRAETRTGAWTLAGSTPYASRARRSASADRAEGDADRPATLLRLALANDAGSRAAPSSGREEEDRAADAAPLDAAPTARPRGFRRRKDASDTASDDAPSDSSELASRALRRRPDRDAVSSVPSASDADAREAYPDSEGARRRDSRSAAIAAARRHLLAAAPAPAYAASRSFARFERSTSSSLDATRRGVGPAVAAAESSRRATLAASSAIRGASSSGDAETSTGTSRGGAGLGRTPPGSPFASFARASASFRTTSTRPPYAASARRFFASAARRLSRICSSFAAARATAVRGW